MSRPAFFLSLILLAAACPSLSQAQFPAGTHSADQPAASSPNADAIRAAEAALESGDNATAVKLLRPLAAANPHDATVQYDLGFAEERSGDEPAARAAFRASADANPLFAEPRIALGLAEARAGDAASAHRDLAAGAAVSNVSPTLRARALRAMASLDESSDPAGARDELLQAVKLTGETPADIQLSARLAEAAGDPTDAEPAFRRALVQDPGDADAAAGLAHVLQQQGKSEEAKTVLETARAANPKAANDPRLVSQLAAVDAADGHTAEAIPLVTSLRARDPKLADDPRLTRLLAHLYLVDHQYAEAEPLYRSLLQTSPDDPSLLDELGSVLVEEQRFPEAEAMLTHATAERAAFATPGDWGEAQGHLAFAASRNADPKVTLQALAARATVLPNSPASLFLEATAHDTLHQRGEAERAYKAFLALAAGKFPDQEFQARHRLVALEHER